jgi:hypothetical protein
VTFLRNRDEIPKASHVHCHTQKVLLSTFS